MTTTSEASGTTMGRSSASVSRWSCVIQTHGEPVELEEVAAGRALHLLTPADHPAYDVPACLGREHVVELRDRLNEWLVREEATR